MEGDTFDDSLKPGQGETGNDHGQKEYQIFTKYYPKLSSTIQVNLNSIKNHLISEQIVMAEDEISNTSEVLKKIAGPLKTGFTTSFYSLLNIMENHGDLACQDLASRMLKETTGSDDELNNSSYRPPSGLSQQFSSPGSPSPMVSMLSSIDTGAQKLIEKYGLIFGKVTTMLMQQLPPAKLAELLRLILASEVYHIPLFSEELLQQFKSSLQILLKPVCTWCDHSILMELSCHCSAAQTLLKEYDSNLDPSLVMSPDVISSSLQIPSPYHQTHTVLYMKCRNNHIQLKDVVNIRSVMVEKCQITKHAIQLLTLQMNNPSTIYWLVPNCVLSVIKMNMMVHGRHLLEKEILEVSIRYDHDDLILHPSPYLCDKQEVPKETDTPAISKDSLMKQLMQAKRNELLLMESLRNEWKEREKYFKLNEQLNQVFTIQDEDEEVFDVSPDTLADPIIRAKKYVEKLQKEKREEISDLQAQVELQKKRIEKLQEDNENLNSQTQSQQSQLMEFKETSTMQPQSNQQQNGSSTVHTDILNSSISVDTGSISVEKTILGQGNYGSLHAATFCGTQCVVKKINLTVVDHSVIKKEIDMLGSLKHPCIVQLLGAFVDSDSLMLVMEKMQQDLANFLSNASRDILVKHSILYDVACGLSYLHSKKVMHRDLTAHNILLNESFDAKIADFCQARFCKQDSSNQKYTKAPGNVFYMPPEALSHTSVYNDKIDVFSFGCVTIYTVTQEFPYPCHEKFSLDGDNYKELTEADRRSPSLNKMKEKQDAQLLYELAIVCLNDNPDKRPDAAAVCAQLAAHKKILEELPKPVGDTVQDKMQALQQENSHLLQKLQEEEAKSKRNIKQLRDELKFYKKHTAMPSPTDHLSANGDNGSEDEFEDAPSEFTTDNNLSLIKGTTGWREAIAQNEHNLITDIVGITDAIALKLRSDIQEDKYKEIVTAPGNWNKTTQLLHAVCACDEEYVFNKFCDVLTELNHEEWVHKLRCAV